MYLQHFQTQSRMGVRSESENDAIAIIHASDAESWAEFLQNKLRSDDYKIESRFHTPHHHHVPNLFSSTNTCAVLVSPCLLEQQHSAFWKRCVDRFHRGTVILFLGVDREDLSGSLGEHLSQQVLKHRWLEVDGSKDAVTSALITLIEAYESADSVHLESLHENRGGEPKSSEQAAGRETFYDDENNYDYLPSPRQLNSILRVIPTILYEVCNLEGIL